MRRIALAALAVMLSGGFGPLSAQRITKMYISTAEHVPERDRLVDVGELVGYSVNVPPVISPLSQAVGRPYAPTDDVATLPGCPDNDGAGARSGYRLVVGPMLEEADRTTVILARACRSDGGKARVLETYAHFEMDENKYGVFRFLDVEQRAERDATQPVFISGDLRREIWSTAFWFLAVAAVGALVLIRAFGSLAGGDSLPIVIGWSIAVILGCVWLLMGAISNPEHWNTRVAIIGVLTVIGGAWMLSAAHGFALRHLPNRGPLVSSAVGAVAGFLVGLGSKEVPGLTLGGAVTGGALYGAVVGITELRHAVRRRERMTA